MRESQKLFEIQDLGIDKDFMKEIFEGEED